MPFSGRNLQGAQDGVQHLWVELSGERAGWAGVFQSSRGPCIEAEPEERQRDQRLGTGDGG